MRSHVLPCSSHRSMPPPYPCTMDLSIVVPLLNERESLPVLAERLHDVIGTMGVDHEIIFVDDGSNDGSWEVITALAAADDRVKGIRFGHNYGKSPALNEGFRAAQGRVVITMDADLQDDPDEVPELFRMITEDGWDDHTLYRRNAPSGTTAMEVVAVPYATWDNREPGEMRVWFRTA